MNNRLTIIDNKGTEHSLSLDEYTRWLCLMEALEHINRVAKNKKINLDENDNWIQPIQLNKYINERYPSLRHDISFLEETY